MGATPSRAGATATADGPAAAWPTLECLRTRGWWRLRFPPAWESAYARERMQARIRSVDLCNIVGCGMFWATTAADAAHAPHFGSTIAALQRSVFAFLVASTCFGVWRGQRRRTWEPDVAISLSLAAITGYVFTLSYLASSPLGAVTASGLLLVIMHSTIVVRQEFRQSLGVVAGIVIGYALVSDSATDQTRLIVDGNLRLLCTAAAFSLVANYVLELRQRRAHVLRLCAVEHQAALARGVQALHRLSHCDPLTGVANRRHFDTLLDGAWLDAGENGLVGLVVLDLDHFKQYNDHCGHPAGDACLVAVAGAIDTVARSHGGSAARLGGEEFAVLLPGLGPDASAVAAAAADAVCAAVRRLAIGHAHSAAASIVTVSAGMAVERPARGGGIACFMAAADAALYAAKDAGRNRWTAAPATRDMAAAVGATVSAPGPADAVTPDDPSSASRRERLQRASRRSGWRLTFEPEVEVEYDRRLSRGRGVRLCLLGIAGLLFSVGYVRCSAPMFTTLSAMVAESIETFAYTVDLPLLLLLLLPMRTWLRESIFALAAFLLSAAVPLLTCAHPTLQLQSYALAVFLPPMFNAVIAEQPFRHCVVPSIATMLVCAALLSPGLDRGDLTIAWMRCTGMTLFATIYSLTASYLLERSTRRIHVLTQLDETDSTALEQQTEHLRRLATVDPLTGIANRRRYDAEQARLWAECTAARQPLALLLLDVDHFKRYNDLHGHPAGDVCLRSVAEALARWSHRLAEQGRTSPLPARLGGEEFGVLLPGCDAADALAHGASLCAAVAALSIVHAGSPTARHVTVSVGAAALTPASVEPGGAPTALLAGADAALYRAKAAGRNRTCA